MQSIWSDDGIAFHLPDADAPPPIEDIMISPDEIEELVVQEVGQSALFGARFRENAARALLIPRRRPDQRTPLWQQRLKAQGLLQVARRYGSFPIILETYRECLQDVFDLPALKRLLHGLRTRELDLVDVETASASPYSASLLFDYIATYMYEDDTPPRNAERRRCRSTAISCASCSVRRSCAICWTRAPSRMSRRSCAAIRATRISCTISCDCAVTCVKASTTKASPRRCCASGARCSCVSPASNG